MSILPIAVTDHQNPHLQSPGGHAMLFVVAGQGAQKADSVHDPPAGTAAAAVEEDKMEVQTDDCSADTDKGIRSSGGVCLSLVVLLVRCSIH